jgi:hypothetical protein
MGIYLVSIGAEDWFGEDEDGFGAIAAALNDELARRGLPSYDSVPENVEFVRGSGQAFEEKLIPSTDGFVKLCDAHLSATEATRLYAWDLMVPFSLDEEIALPIEAAYSDKTVVAGAPQVLPIAERLAAAIGLPPETPEMCDNLDLTMWFLQGAAKDLAATRPGLWSEDLDAAFYAALFLRAAQHSLRRGCPMTFI